MEKNFEQLKKFWFGELGLKESELVPNKTVVTKHGALAGYKGVFYFLGKGCCVISAPEKELSFLSRVYEGISALEAFSSEAITKILGGKLDLIVGPAWIGMISEKWFTPCHGDQTQLLESGDVMALLEACTEEERAHSSLGGNMEETVGLYIGNLLVAAAGYEIRGGCVAHIGVLVHPLHRGKGYSKVVISAITERALNTDYGVQYQTLVSNQASVKAAAALGFKPFAFTIAARLK